MVGARHWISLTHHSCMLLATIVATLATAPAANSDLTATPDLRALVWEAADRYTGQTGAARSLIEVGMEVDLFDTAVAFDTQLRSVDLLFLGSFISEDEAYAPFWSGDHGHVATLLAWVAEGGTVVQMTQADQTEAQPAFLPSTGDSAMVARRDDVDVAPVLALALGHPLVDPIATQAPPAGSADGTPPRIPRSVGHHRPGAWEAFNAFEGMHVLFAGDVGRRKPVVLEGAHGKGRIVLAALFFDKLDDLDEDGAPHAAAPKDFLKLAGAWFAGIGEYVGLVRSGRAAAVVPSEPYVAPPPAPFVEGSFTLAILPDTQVYAERYPQHFIAQTRWIVENQSALDIRYVLHLGDITNRNTPEQWANAKAAIDVLDEAGVPYILAPGNHDYGPGGTASTRQTLLSETFPVESYIDWESFGGTHETGMLDSSYHTFSVGSGPSKRSFLLLALEWGPRQTCVEWANRIVEAHPEHEAILVTHAYMFSDETRYDWAVRGKSQTWNPHGYGVAELEGGVNDGEELWRELVSLHPGFIMTLNGHVLNDGQALLTSEGRHGNTVHQMLCNYQTWHEGGDGYLRLYEFRPDGSIQAKSYSPILDEWLTFPDQQFLLTYPRRPQADGR